VDSLENVAYVLGRAALRRVQLEVVGVGSVLEPRLRVVRRQAVEEAAQGLRDTVIEFIAGSPEGV
jgi:hypothetical protein